MTQKYITLVYDCIDYEDHAGYFISFGDNCGIYITKTGTYVDNEAMTIEIPLWLAIAKEIEMYEE